MKFHQNRALAVALVMAVSFLAFLQAVAQNTPSGGKIPCVGCSVDGKTTPRMPDGHPNLNGFWGGLSGGAEQGGNHVSERGADGSVLFDFGGADVDAQGRNRSTLPAGTEDNPGWSIGSAKAEDNP